MGTPVCVEQFNQTVASKMTSQSDPHSPKAAYSISIDLNEVRLYCYTTLSERDLL